MLKIICALKEGHITEGQLNVLGRHLELKAGKLMLPEGWPERLERPSHSQYGDYKALTEAVQRAEAIGMVRKDQRKRMEGHRYIVNGGWLEGMKSLTTPGTEGIKTQDAKCGLVESLVKTNALAGEELEALSKFFGHGTTPTRPVAIERLAKRTRPITQKELEKLSSALEKAKDQLGMVEEKKSSRQGEPNTLQLKEFWAERLREYAEQKGK